MTASWLTINNIDLRAPKASAIRSLAICCAQDDDEGLGFLEFFYRDPVTRVMEFDVVCRDEDYRTSWGTLPLESLSPRSRSKARPTSCFFENSQGGRAERNDRYPGIS
jgi:hypothetical protein